MVRFRSILVVHTGGARGDAALTRAINLARGHRARLTIAEILPTGLAQQLFPANGAPGASRAEARKRVGSYLALARDAGLRALPVVLEGKACAAICGEVVRHHHDLVIMGGKDRTSLLGMFDSTVFELASRCPCPVWVAKSPDSSPLRRVAAVIGYSDSERSLTDLDSRVVTLASVIARSEACHLDILRPWDFRGRDLEISRSELLPEMFEALHEKHRAEHSAGVEDLLSDVGMNGLDCQIHLPHEAADQAAIRFALEKKVDLVVMGFVGAQGFKKLISYDLAEGIMARAGCSTITVKQDDYAPQVSVVEQFPVRRPVYHPQRIGVTSGTLSKRMR